jgi:hypothetical protein
MHDISSAGRSLGVAGQSVLGAFDPEFAKLGQVEDLELMSRIALVGDIGCIPEALGGTGCTGVLRLRDISAYSGLGPLSGGTPGGTRSGPGTQFRGLRGLDEMVGGTRELASRPHDV